MSFRTSTPFDSFVEPSSYHSESYAEEFFDEFLNLDEHCQIVDQASIFAAVPTSPHMATAPSPSQSQTSNSEPYAYLSHRFSQADSDVGYWSNYSRQQSPVGRGRSQTFSEHQTSRRRPGSQRFDPSDGLCQSPPCYTMDSSPPSPTQPQPVTSSPHNIVNTLRRKKGFHNRSFSNFRSAREPSCEREVRRSTRSVSRSAIRKPSNTPKMLKQSSAGAYSQVTLEEWNAKLAHQASQFDFGFQTSSAPPMSPPPSARVSDASSSESTKGIMRAQASLHQRRQQQHHQQSQNQQQQQHQYAVARNSHMLTPLTTPKYNEVAMQQNNEARFTHQSQQWGATDLQDLNASFDMSYVVDPEQWWEEPAAMSEQETNPVVLSHNESYSQPMAISPNSNRNMNTKSLQIALPPAEQRHKWPTINSIDTTVDVDLTISPGVRPTPIALTSSNHFAGHAHTRSLPNTDHMLLQPHISLPPSPTRATALPGSAEPSPLRHQKSGSYFSNVAPPPVPAYLQSQQPSPLLPQHSSPLRHGKTLRDRDSPPSRSTSPAFYSQSFPNSQGLMAMNNNSTPNFSTPHPHPYPLQVRKSRALSHKQSEPSFASHHQRGRSSQLSAAGYPNLPPSTSQSFPLPSGSPSPRMRSRTHGRSKSSSNLRSTSSGICSTKRSSSAKKGKDTGISMEIEFHNFTPQDGNRILSGVAPSGSSKTKARREKEALEKRRRLSELAVKAVTDLGGDPGAFGFGEESAVDSSEDGVDIKAEGMGNHDFYVL